MKMKKGMRALSLLMAVVFFGAIFVSAVSADNVEISNSVQLDENLQAGDFIISNSNSCVKASEMLKIIDPEFYQNLSEAQKKEFDNMDVNIPDLNDPEGSSEFNIKATKKESDSKTGFEIPAYVNGYADCKYDSFLGLTGAFYEAKQTATLIMPQMRTTVYLNYRLNSNYGWNDIGSAEETATLCTYLEASGIEGNPDNGDYQALGCYYGVFPPGYSPQSYLGYSTSPIMTLS